MNYDTLLSLIGHYGYFALFFALWLGIVGMPIPDEVVVMTGGAAAGSERPPDARSPDGLVTVVERGRTGKVRGIRGMGNLAGRREEEP